MMRCGLNAYGSQAGRFQPGSTGFLFLKSAWMRSLAVPPPGWAYVGIDYKSEEFLIKALQSQDMKMIFDYKTGDVYLAFGKSSNMIPKEATKKTHPVERQASKSSVLGISYDMTEFGLAIKLTNESPIGKVYTEDEALKYIEAFNSTYHVAFEHKQYIQDSYDIKGFIRLSDGWTMFGDNNNFRSVGNCPTQGEGGVILRKAIRRCIENKLRVSIPLHDALYCLIKIEDLAVKVDLFADIMIKSFKDCFEGPMKKHADVMLDIEVWSPELEEGTLVTYQGRKVKVESVHRDDRAGDEYERFKKYFEKPDWLYV